MRVTVCFSLLSNELLRADFDSDWGLQRVYSGIHAVSVQSKKNLRCYFGGVCMNDMRYLYLPSLPKTLQSRQILRTDIYISKVHFSRAVYFLYIDLKNTTEHFIIIFFFFLSRIYHLYKRHLKANYTH